MAGNGLGILHVNLCPRYERSKIRKSHRNGLISYLKVPLYFVLAVCTSFGFEILCTKCRVLKCIEINIQLTVFTKENNTNKYYSEYETRYFNGSADQANIKESMVVIK